GGGAASVPSTRRGQAGRLGRRRAGQGSCAILVSQPGTQHRGRMLMKIPKPTEADRERFTGLVPRAPDVEIKPMFGNLGAFVNGNMFMGLFGSDVGIKLPEDDQQRLLA